MNNKIGDEGVNSLIQYLECIPNLEDLRLCNCAYDILWIIYSLSILYYKKYIDHNRISEGMKEKMKEIAEEKEILMI